MSFTVRAATRRDIPAITGLWHEMMEYHSQFDARFRFLPAARRDVERHITETLRARSARVFVAETDSRVVGYILGEIHARRPLYPAGTYGFIADLSVTAEHRRAGVGRALVEAMLAWFRGEKATAVELFAAEANPTSLAFWRAMGFGDYLRLLRRELE